MAIDTSVLARVAPRDFHPRAGMNIGKERWLDADGIRTRYFDEGRGERIVFVHGGNLGSNDGSGGATTWNVNFPVLVYWGYNDPVAPIEMGLKLYDMIAKHQFRTQMHTVNKTGYFSFRERPDEFNRVVCEFVEGVSYGD